MPPQIGLLKLTSPKIILDMYENKHIVQDMLVTINQLKASLESLKSIIVTKVTLTYSIYMRISFLQIITYRYF